MTFADGSTASGFFVAGSTRNPGQVVFETGAAVVPLPAGLPLLAGGLALLAAVGRAARRKTA